MLRNLLFGVLLFALLSNGAHNHKKKHLKNHVNKQAKETRHMEFSQVPNSKACTSKFCFNSVTDDICDAEGGFCLAPDAVRHKDLLINKQISPKEATCSSFRGCYCGEDVEGTQVCLGEVSCNVETIVSCEGSGDCEDGYVCVSSCCSDELSGSTLQQCVPLCCEDQYETESPVLSPTPRPTPEPTTPEPTTPEPTTPEPTTPEPTTPEPTTPEPTTPEPTTPEPTTPIPTPQPTTPMPTNEQEVPSPTNEQYIPPPSGPTPDLFNSNSVYLQRHRVHKSAQRHARIHQNGGDDNDDFPDNDDKPDAPPAFIPDDEPESPPDFEDDFEEPPPAVEEEPDEDHRDFAPLPIDDSPPLTDDDEETSPQTVSEDGQEPPPAVEEEEFNDDSDDDNNNKKNKNKKSKLLPFVYFAPFLLVAAIVGFAFIVKFYCDKNVYKNKLLSVNDQNENVPLIKKTINYQSTV